MAQRTKGRRYIPFRKRDLLLMLLEDGKLSMEQDKQDFQRLCQLIENVFHFRFFDKSEALKDNYYPINPDLKKGKNFSPEEIERASKDLVAVLKEVLNDANFGGWLELAFWLARPTGATESRFKMTMDNRGLVVGQDRFLEYDQLRQMAGDWPRILSRWGVDVAILPSRAVIVQALTSGAAATPGAGATAWEPIYTSAIWTVLVRRSRDERDGSARSAFEIPRSLRSPPPLSKGAAALEQRRALREQRVHHSLDQPAHLLGETVHGTSVTGSHIRSRIQM